MVGRETTNQSLGEFDGTCKVSEVGANGMNYRIHVENVHNDVLDWPSSSSDVELE